MEVHKVDIFERMLSAMRDLIAQHDGFITRMARSYNWAFMRCNALVSLKSVT